MSHLHMLASRYLTSTRATCGLPGARPLPEPHASRYPTSTRATRGHPGARLLPEPHAGLLRPLYEEVRFVYEAVW